MKKILFVLLIIAAIGILFWQQSLEKKQLVFQIIGFVCLFYGMARLSAKTPSKYKNEDE